MSYLNLRITYIEIVSYMNNIDAYIKLQKIYCPDCKSRIRFLNAYVNNQCPYCKNDLNITPVCA